jgi:hypothetical protein
METHTHVYIDITNPGLMRKRRMNITKRRWYHIKGRKERCGR